VEDLRQGRHRHLGNPADRLPAHALGHAQPRAARLRPRRQLQLVPVQRQPRQVPDGARPPAQAWRARAGRKTPVDAWASIVENDAKRRDYQSVRGMGGFVRSELGRGQRDHRRANVYTIKKYGPTA
jgi:hypothetical protein